VGTGSDAAPDDPFPEEPMPSTPTATNAVIAMPTPATASTRMRMRRRALMNCSSVQSSSALPGTDESTLRVIYLLRVLRIP